MPSRDWPAPGVLWGTYPVRAADAPRQRESGWTARRLRSFAKLPELADDPASRALVRAAHAMAAAGGRTPRWQQLMAARALLDQRLVEMDTGEGKTLVLALAAGAAALLGSPVQVVTANDYLAERDAQWLAPFFAALGLRVAAVTGGQLPAERRAAYAAHVTYVTGRELAFDALRDGLAAPASGNPLADRLGPGGRLLPGLCVALLDEADALLVDEARTPLVLADADDAQQRAFLQAAFERVKGWREGEHFRVAVHDGRVRLLPDGEADLGGEWGGGGDALHRHPLHRREAATLAVQALHGLRVGRDYLVVQGRVELVDPVTGRVSPGRAWSRGLQQLVEIKEGVAPTATGRTMAQTTYQQFFQRYCRLAGISGTLREAGSELSATYGLAVLRVPRHVPANVRRGPERMFPTSQALWAAVAARAGDLARSGRPVLVGVNSVGQRAALSAELARHRVAHAILDAGHDEAESAVIEAAGRSAQVTVATSMAGRGSDILLDAAARTAGGLHVLLCQWNASGRIDRQFRGRAGRQGEPGSFEHWLAADFDAFRPPLLRAAAALLARWPSPVGVRAFITTVQRLQAAAASKHRVTMARQAEAQALALGFSRERPT